MNNEQIWDLVRASFHKETYMEMTDDEVIYFFNSVLEVAATACDNCSNGGSLDIVCKAFGETVRKLKAAH